MPINKQRIEDSFKGFDIHHNGVLQASDFRESAKGAVTRAKAAEGTEVYNAIMKNYKDGWEEIAGDDASDSRRVCVE